MRNELLLTLAIAVAGGLLLLAGCSADGVDASDDGGAAAVLSDSEGTGETVEPVEGVEEVVDAGGEDPTSPSYGGEWIEDYEEAKALAVALDRPMLLDFAGSDWCGWCMKLDDEVFTKKAFKDFAKENLVLVLLDFPRDKPQSAERKLQNARLKAALGVGGFPTVVLLSPDGREIGRGGYRPGGPSPYVDWISDTIAEE